MILSLFFWSLGTGEIPSWPLPLCVLGGSATAAILASGGDDPGSDPLQIGRWLLVLGAVLWIANQIVTLWQSLKKPEPTHIPQPFATKEEHPCVPKPDFDNHAEEVWGAIETLRASVAEAFEKLRTHIDGKFDDLDKKRSVSVARLHEEVGGVRDRVSATEQLAESLNQGLHAANQRIDGIRRPRS